MAVNWAGWAGWLAVNWAGWLQSLPFLGTAVYRLDATLPPFHVNILFIGMFLTMTMVM